MGEPLNPANPDDFDPELVGEKLAAMIEAEAAAAEAETPPESGDEEGAEDEETEGNRRIMEALGNYLGVVQDVMGEENPVSPCVFCHGFGFNSIALLPDSHTNRCEECGGFGRVTTGSLVTGNETRGCEGCGGTGFKADGAAPLQLTPETPAPEGIKILSPAEVEQIAAQARAAGPNAA